MDGAWYDSGAPGQGFFVDAHPDPQSGDFIFVSWFTFDGASASGQRWLTAQGGFTGPGARIVVHETTGGSFDDPGPTTTVPVGTLDMEFFDCGNALFRYALPGESADGEIAVTRVIPGGQAWCEELDAAD
jgi:hypothetical protein